MSIGVVVGIAAVATALVLGAFRWLNKRRTRSESARYSGAVTEVRAKVNDRAMAKNDDYPCQVLLTVEYDDGGRPVVRKFGWHNSGQLPGAVRRRTVGSVVIAGNPRFAISDPDERQRALQAAKQGGYTFRLDPPMPAVVYVHANGSFAWELA